MKTKWWYARDYYGDVYIYPTKPYKGQKIWIGERMSFFYVPDDKLPEGVNPQWKDEEPIEVEVTIRKVSKHD